MSLYVPAFPIAEWVVRNWWSLFNELCSWELVPKSANDAVQMSWLRRHCLRSADSALMLPALYLFNDGRSVRVEWHSDPPESMPNMPGEFISDGAEQLDAYGTQEALAQFISDVRGRVAHVDDERVNELTGRWRAIQAANHDEQKFCTLAGRMGIDPYDDSEMTDELARFLEQTFPNPDDPLVRDLTEVAQPDSIVRQWQWLTNVSTDLQLGPISAARPLGIPSSGLSPPQFGYQLARNVRAAAGITPDSRLDSVESIAQIVLGRPLRIEDRNHFAGRGVKAIVGQSAGEVITAGPKRPREDSQRFMIARSLYHAFVSNERSCRLVTEAYSWDQKASRAFAAELLAPQRALAQRVSASGADIDAVQSLSREFEVSSFVIKNQLENSEIAVSDE